MLDEARTLPAGFVEDVIFKAPAYNLMNQLSRSVLALYSYDLSPDDTSLSNMLRQSVEIVARMPLIVANAHAVMRHYLLGHSLYIHNPKPGLSLAENFLRMVRADKAYTEEEARILDMMLMPHADHGGGNNSTFTCRCVSSTDTDTYSAIAAAIRSLKGPLHGGANAKVMEMFGHIKAEVKITRTTTSSAPTSSSCWTAAPATSPARSTAWVTRCIPCRSPGRGHQKARPLMAAGKAGWRSWS